MRVFITGAAGFIGSHLADHLLSRGDTVCAVDNFNEYYDPLIKRANVSGAQNHEHYSLHECDICDGHALRELMGDFRADVVVHLAARAGVRPSLEDPQLYHRVNIIGSQHILDGCREFTPSHLVFASSSSVYGGITEVPFRESMTADRLISPYAATKRMNELMSHVYHHLYGLNVTLLRFFTAYGPRQRPDMAIHKFVRLISEGNPIPMFGDGSTARDYTYIDDIIDGVVKSIDNPFGYEIFNLGEHHTTTLRELIDKIGAAMDVAPKIERLPVQPGDVTITYADISKARDMLGYAPKTSIDDGIGEFVRWFNATPMLGKAITND